MSYLNTTIELRIVEFVLVATVVATSMAVAHVALRGVTLPRWAAYVVGVSIIFVGWFVWRGLLLRDWYAVIELAGLVMAGAIAPTLGRALMNYQQARAAATAAAAAAAVRQVRLEAMEE